MNRVGDKKFYEGLSFLRDLLSSLDEDERLNFPADLETIFLCSHDSDAKPMRLEAVVRFYNYFCELKEKLHHGEKLCERFLSAIDEGELEAFDVGDLVTRDNVERDDEDCRFNGSIEVFVGQSIEQYETNEEEAAEASGLTVSVSEFIDFLKEDWEYPFYGEAGQALDFQCVYNAIKNEMMAFLEENRPNVQLVE